LLVLGLGESGLTVTDRVTLLLSRLEHADQRLVEWTEEVDQFFDLNLAIVVGVQVKEDIIHEVVSDWHEQLVASEELS